MTKEEAREELISRADAIRKVASYIWHLPNSVYPHFNSYNVIENFVMDALSALPSADRPRPIDPTIKVDLESGVVPISACEPKAPKTIIYADRIYVDRPRGRWHYSDGKPATIGRSFGVICDQCGAESEYCTNFCGECGADMRGDTE